MTNTYTLPIDAMLPEIRSTLERQTRAVLVAEPGAGKTTRIPLALLNEPWLQGRKLLLLEPRRLAAKAAARHMAEALGEAVGETVGYRVRLETKVSGRTRIEVITEGVLTRMLQHDPSLEEAGIVVFDEFHERSLQADLGLALCLEAQDALRDDLRLLVMSATLDAAAVSGLMADAPVLVSEGRTFPVETRYMPPLRSQERMEQAVARVVETACLEAEGDVLVFLPGAAEIRRVEALLAGRPGLAGIRLAPLYGMLPPQAQEAALRAGKPGERKIVLSTPIAESSLTVDGVRIVVDSGLMRAPRFSPRTGMTRLETQRASRASADQRRGRAGRQAPGICYRVWSEAENRMLSEHRTPEIAEADLAPLALELAAWGAADPGTLRWLTPPPAGAYRQARELLRQLGALDASGALTAHGRQMAELGMEPRLAHMILRAIPLGLGEAACELAALLQERDIFRSESGGADADLRQRYAALRSFIQGLRAGERGSSGADEAAKRRVVDEAAQWKRKLSLKGNAGQGDDCCGLLLAFAYPDRIAQGRGDGRFQLSGGRGVVFGRMQSLSMAAYLAVAELDDQGTDSRILLAAPIAEEELYRHLGDAITKESVVYWDGQARNVRARQRVKLGALTLKENVWEKPDPDALLAAMLEGIRTEGLQLLNWSKAGRQLRERLSFMHRHTGDGRWPDVSDEALLATLEEWLGPHLYGMKQREELQRLQPAALLEGMLSWAQRQALESQAPTHWTVPSGSRIPIDYSDPDAPLLAVRLQEMFGLQQTPRLAEGKVPLVLHLLSPAHRPVQVTRDLASFWREAYFEVKKDLKGRYPKHVWPDDPLSAAPTSRAKPRV
ncbi:ATP-dependent helicase HrpB [Paenibacillus sp. UNCCL117]|uniref:ATP-dependent helicase HrpB n=1 Tax=unclassified Paenibacillus TaxID=185978 RepID=UPI0008918329|nr:MULTISPECIES: ATP-dependent helicase HrpB [unclassified Paenibacillus]SDC89165.1 ATP-dependent helicase HrpB [Paenibacillus sp. cl123]SFW28484.1 ATP-dependent helicase HrpB [Paenibacillus sp. UNCCL117]